MSLFNTSPIILRLFILTQAEIDNPTQAQLADYSAFYQLNVAPYTKYASNGTALVLAANVDLTTIQADIAALETADQTLNASIASKADATAYSRLTHTGRSRTTAFLWSQSLVSYTT
jgi:hypothetical protein